MPYLGKTPSQATRKRYYKTASGGETSLSGTMTTGGTLTFNDGEFVDVSVNGVALVAGTDYNTTTANTIGGLSALSANDQVEIVVYDTFSVFGGNVDGDFNLNNGTMTLTRDDNEPQLIIKSTDADATSGPEIELFRDSASPADSDAVGQIQFKGKNDAAETILYGEIDAFIRDASDGTEDGEVRINVMRNGTSREAVMFGQETVVFNEGGLDINFRVESDNQASMFFVDAGNDRIGINNGSPSYLIDALGTGTGDNADAVMRIKAQGTGDSDVNLILDSADTGESLVSFYNQGNNEASIEWVNATSQLNIRTETGTNAPIDIQPNNTLTARFETNGDLTLEDGNLVIGTSGHGIDFSATTNGGVSTPIELLSDYEEGTWTPTLTTNTGSAASASTLTGHYTRIGRAVHVTAVVGNITAGDNAAGLVRITGLPYTIDSHKTYGAAGFDNCTLNSPRTYIIAEASTSEYVQFLACGGGASDNTFDHANLDSNTSDLFFSVTYYTNQ